MIFCDASSTAICAAAFLRTENDTKIENENDNENEQRSHCVTRWVQGQGHTHQDSKHPQLYLTAATLGVKMGPTLCPVLGIDPTTFRYFMDNTGTLLWIRGHGSDFKPYVKNKIHEIQLDSDASQWSPVTSEENPAEIGSRDASPQSLLVSELWQEGPAWFKRPETEWPSSEVVPPLNHPLPDQRKVAVRAHATLTEDHPLDRLINETSSYRRLVRKTG